MASTRRSLLVGLALPAIATGCHALPAALPRHAAAEPHPDAELLAMGPALAGLIAAAREAAGRFTAAEEIGFERSGPSPEKPKNLRYGTREQLAYAAACAAYTERCIAVEDEIGLPALEADCKAADSRLIDGCSSLAEARATTLDGLVFKARFVDHADDDLIESIVADLLAMAGGAA